MTHDWARALTAVLLAGCAIGQGQAMTPPPDSFTVRVETENAAEAKGLKAVARYRATRYLPLVNCDYQLNILGGSGEWRIRNDAVETRQLTAKGEGRERYFGKTPYQPWGPSRWRLEELAVSVNGIGFNIHWAPVSAATRLPGAPPLLQNPLRDGMFYFDDVLYLNYYPSQERPPPYQDSLTLALEERPRALGKFRKPDGKPNRAVGTKIFILITSVREVSS